MEREFKIKNQVWKDCTSYSRGDENKIPTAFETTVGDIRITITNGHIHFKPDFIMNCYDLNLNQVVLQGCATHKEAAERAYDLCKSKVFKMIKEFNNNQ